MSFIIRVVKLFLGLLLYSIAIMLTINANIGYTPWDIFHVGVSLATGLSLGNVSILTGLIVLAVSVLMGEKFGIGTIANMVMIGIFIDLIIYLNIIPIASSFLVSIFMLIIGLVIICFATYFYINSGFGAGPRDSFMVALSKNTRLSIGMSRGLIEFSAAVIGYFLGGMVGIGTIISVIVIGPMMEIIFKFLKFNPKLVEHENIRETFKFLTKI